MRLLKLLAVAALAALVTLSSAHAEDKKTVAMKVGDAIALRDALKAAVGTHDKIIGQGTSSQAVAPNQLYDIDATARWTLNDDILALNTVLDGVDLTEKQLRDAIIKDNGGAPLPTKAADLTSQQQKLIKDFNDKIFDLRDSPRDFPALAHIKRGDLKEAMPGDITVPMERAGILDRQ
jgi:hypothetical protein